MKIFADRNILAVEQRFSRHGSLQLFDGRGVSRADIHDADVLLVRSITPVDERLLKGSKVRFVGTATSGVDHVDVEYLRNAGIEFAHAKGSNANAVVDYCFAALAYAAIDRGYSLQGSRVGILGAGAVGGLFALRLEALGVEVLRCDPPLASEGQGEHEYFPLEETLACDVLSLHVPLIRTGRHPTENLIGATELARLRNAVLINACRGGVVDESALKIALADRDDLLTVFDVWANEPQIDLALMRGVDVSTPHIAGYSAEAKLNATEMLAKALETHFELRASDTTFDCGAPEFLETASAPDAMRHWRTLLQAFPLAELSAQFKAEFASEDPAAAFDLMRQRLRQRRESRGRLLAGANYSDEQRSFLATLGFNFC